MEKNALKVLYIDELRDIYNAENQLVKALPKMAKASTSDDLRVGFEEHLEQTKGHVQRLEQIFAELDEKPTGKKCKGMEGLVQEGKEMIDEQEGEVLDAGLISAAQRVEHYEIAAYGCVRTDKKLTSLAEKINVEASAQEGQENSQSAGAKRKTAKA
jgi:ferritin-like metal-binding protein YciE